MTAHCTIPPTPPKGVPRRAPRGLRSGAVVCLLAAAAVVLAPRAWSQPLVLAVDEAVPGEGPLRPAVLGADDGGATRADDGEAARTAYYARVDAAAMRLAMASAGGSGGAEIALAIAPDNIIRSRAAWIERRAGGGLTWSGSVEGDPLGHVLLVVEPAAGGDTAAGRITTGGGTYDVRHAGRGRQVIYGAEPGGGSCGVRADPPAGSLRRQIDASAHSEASWPEGGERPLLRSAVHVPPTSTRNDTVSVLVLYTTPVRESLQDGLAAFVQALISTANDHLVRSEVSGRVVLAGMREVAEPDLHPTEPSMTQTVLRALTDQRLVPAEEWRRETEADLVSFLIAGGDYCGIAHVPPQEGQPQKGYSVLKYGCRQVVTNFTHEFGHNMGLHHDPYVARRGAPFPHGHGYVDPWSSFRTIMAYPDRCSVEGRECPLVPYFSNPRLSIDGAALGEVGRSDAASVLNHMFATVSGYVESFPRRDFEAPDLFVTGVEDEEITIARPAQDQAAGSVAFAPSRILAQHGKVRAVGDLHLIYRPDPDFHGVDSFRYFVTRRYSFEQPKEGAVYLTITPAEDPPAASAIYIPFHPVVVHPDSSDLTIKWSRLYHPDHAEGEVTLSARWQLLAFDPTRDGGEVLLERSAGQTQEHTVPMANLSTFLDEQGVEVGGEAVFLQRVVVSDGLQEMPGPTAHIRFLFTKRAQEPAPVEPLESVRVAIFPNPAIHTLHVELAVPNADAVTVALYDILGREVRRTDSALNSGENVMSLEVGGLAAGVYLYEIRSLSGRSVERGRVIVQ